ncbi:replication protein A 70 kDa DNA-binding subunit C [Trifolium repens]|nr:replication protein A 70 kDa DNA-binding subunit C [Trifolium repens]
MSNFSIFPQSGFYRTTFHPYKLVFNTRTYLKLFESDDISQFGLNFTNIAKICAHTHDYEYLVDVIGIMVGMSTEREYIRYGKVTKMVIVELTDHRKESIQNVLHTTRILINPDILEVESFKLRQPSFEEEFLHMHPKKTIDELISISDGGVFVVCAEVVQIVDGHDWWYPTCKCHKSVVADSGAYFCSACDRDVFNVIPRFRVKLEITNGKATCVFVLLDSDMSYMMEKSCSFFVAQSKAENFGPRPVEFDTLVGHKMLFVVDTSSKQPAVSNGSYRVKRVCMDPAIIRSFCSQCPGFSSSKALFNSIDVESNVDSYGSDYDDDLQCMDFVDDLIVTPPMTRGKDEVGSDVPATVKRNLSKVFDKVAKGHKGGRLKKVTIEKD